jgi:hypothetical protein
MVVAGREERGWLKVAGSQFAHGGEGCVVVGLARDGRRYHEDRRGWCVTGHREYSMVVQRR